MKLRGAAKGSDGSCHPSISHGVVREGDHIRTVIMNGVLSISSPSPSTSSLVRFRVDGVNDASLKIGIVHS